MLSSRGQAIIVLLLLATHVGLLAYSATRHSPTHLEPAFLVSGISHWQFGRFELYRVNPPLVRMVAALPVLAAGCETNWSKYDDRPGSRAEFPLGEDFLRANGPRSIPLVIYARWACIPFSLIGAFFAYRWAHELYGRGAGLVVLTLYVFDPNLLAHGELITSDGACTAFGVLAGYSFWRWLNRPTWMQTTIAAATLGLAELSKMSWLILFGVWPLLWMIWRWREPKAGLTVTALPREPAAANNTEVNLHTNSSPAFRIGGLSPQPSLLQLATILLLSVYIINLGYAFDGFGTRLNEFQFVSTALTGLDEAGKPGNRFQNSWIGVLPVPFPKQFVLGFDSQKKDLENFGQKSYLRGEWKDGGWWYYYLYGLLVKVPCGTWGLLALVVALRLARRDRPVPLRDELILLTPAAAMLLLVSSQTEFSIHLRYVLPSLGIAMIFLGSACTYLTRQSLFSTLALVMIGYSTISTLLVYPHHLAYFNDFVGGPRNGRMHLLGSSLCWGQDLLLLDEIAQSTLPRGKKVYLATSKFRVAACWSQALTDIPSDSDIAYSIEDAMELSRGGEIPANWQRIGYSMFLVRIPDN